MTTSFDIPGKVHLAAGTGGLPRFEITTSLGSAHVYLHGAHITHFAPPGEPPVLFMSERSAFSDGKPIRGGVPVIFPWFGPRQGHAEAPAHGFARTRTWCPESVVEQPDGKIVLVLRLEPDAASRATWPGEWILRHRITVAGTLTMEVEIENTGETPLRCEEALHTYFSVSNVKDVAVTGLQGVEYVDRLDGIRKREEPHAIRFTAETDRTYVNTDANCTISDPGLNRKILVEKTGSAATVVWNPWIAKAKAMPDFGDDEWPFMVCVETGNMAEKALTIAPGTRHVTKTVLRTIAT